MLVLFIFNGTIVMELRGKDSQNLPLPGEHVTVGVIDVVVDYRRWSYNSSRTANFPVVVEIYLKLED